MHNSKIEILLIEDNLSDAGCIREMLSRARQQEFSVQHVQSLMEGLSLLRSRNFHVVLVDLGLPDSQGLEAALAVRRQSKRTPVVALTVLDDEETALKSLQMDIQDYLIKSEINGSLLSRAIRYAIQRKRDVELLRDSENHYRTLFNAIDEGFCIIEVLFDENEKPIDYRFLETNPSFEKHTGLIDAQGKRMRELAPEHEEYWFETYGKIALTGQPARFQNRASRLHRWYDLYAFRFGRPENRQVAIFFNDITERKQVEAEIQRLASFPLMNPNPVLELDARGTVTFCNPAAKQLLEKAEYSNSINPFIPHDLPVMLQDLRDNKAGQFFREVETNDRFFEELIYIVPQLQSVRIYTMDITERKRMAEVIERLNTDLAARAADLEATNRELETFTYTVAHDLRKPLTVVNGYCQTLSEICGNKLDEACKAYIQEAYDGTWRMNQLIDTLLKFSRLIHTEPHRETVDLSAMAQVVAAELKLVEPGRRVTFLIAEGISANGDANLLRVVLENLLGNAWKYTCGQEEAVIEFGVTSVGEQTAYVVRDNGPGFDMADAEKLFAPFQRLPGTDETKGHGIGLATVDRIIRRHGGRVWAEGEPGKGATFYFTLQD